MKILAMFLLIGSTLSSALPPLAQSVKEIEAIMGDPEIQSRLGSAEPIEEIRRTEEGYALFTSSRLMLVDVEPIPFSKKVGPIPFRLHFHDPVSLGKKGN